MRLRILTAAAAAAVVSASAFAAHSSVGVVDVETVFNQAPQGHASLLKIKSEMSPKIAALKKDQASIEADVKAVEKNAPTMTKAQKDAKEKALVAKQHAFQNKVMALRSSEMKLEQTAATTFSTDLKAASKTVGQKDGYSVVITSQAAPYSADSVNVTKDVVAAMKKLKG